MTLRLQWRTWLAVICIFCSDAGVRLRAQVPVEGDANLLRVLQDRQEMNRSLFREGECDVAAEERVEDVRARAHLVWRGENTFWDYVYVKEIAIPRPEGPEPAMSTVQARMIEGPGVFMWYNSSASLARMHKRERRGSGYPSILELRPDQAWFGMDEPFGTRPNWNWHSLFDPSHGVEYLAKVVVRPETGERVVFERH